MITSDQLVHFEKALERCDGYTTLGMIDEARDELASVPAELRITLPFITACINFCTHFEWWDQAADLGLEALVRWPERNDIREVTARCLVNAGRRSEVLHLLADIFRNAPRRR